MGGTPGGLKRVPDWVPRIEILSGKGLVNLPAFAGLARWGSGCRPPPWGDPGKGQDLGLPHCAIEQCFRSTQRLNSRVAVGPHETDLLDLQRQLLVARPHLLAQRGHHGLLRVYDVTQARQVSRSKSGGEG